MSAAHAGAPHEPTHVGEEREGVELTISSRNGTTKLGFT